jgi:hypothetical protein
MFDGRGLQTLRRPAVGSQDPPPRHIGGSAGHDRSYLTRTTLLQYLSYVAISEDLSRGYQVDDVQDRLVIVQSPVAHQPTLPKAAI